MASVTTGFFEVLGATPLWGRFFGESDETAGQNQVAVISNGTLRTRFANDPRAVGQTVRLDGVPYTIVGVLPPSFDYPPGSTYQIAVFVPIAFSPGDRQRGVQQSMSFTAIGRLRQDVSISDASRVMTGLQTVLDRDYVGINRGYSEVLLSRLDARRTEGARRWALLLSASIGLIVLLVATNIVGLVVINESYRAHESAVRIALGASRGRLLVDRCLECLILAAYATVAGMLLAASSVRIIQTVLPADLPRPSYVEMGIRVVAFTAFTAIGIALVATLLGSRHIGLRAPAVALRFGARTGTSVMGLRLRQMATWAQLSVSLILVVVAGLLVRSVLTISNKDMGFEPVGLTAFGVSVPANIQGSDAVRGYVATVRSAIASVPGTQVSLIEGGGPFSGGFVSAPFSVIGREVQGGPSQSERIRFKKVGADFLGTARGRVIAGRDFDTSRSTDPVALINRAAAERHWRDLSAALGSQLRIQKTVFDIVGVYENMSFDDPDQEDVPEVLIPYEVSGRGGVTFVVRMSPEALPEVKTAIWRVNPDQPLTDLSTGSALFVAATAPYRFASTILLLSAGLGVAIAIVGIYALFARIVVEKTREIGIRMALGAGPRQIKMVIIRQAAVLSMAGVCTGLFVVNLLSTPIEAFLFGTTVGDQLVSVLAIALLVLVAVAAAAVPAFRAGRLNLVQALKAN